MAFVAINNTVNSEQAFTVVLSCYKYPYPLTTACEVVVNDDDYLPAFQFKLVQKKKGPPLLPQRVVLYGKADGVVDTLYLNFWVPIFIDTVEEGCIQTYTPSNLVKGIGDPTLFVGLARAYRERYINGDEEAAKDFIVALFGGRRKVQLKEVYAL